MFRIRPTLIAVLLCLTQNIYPEKGVAIDFKPNYIPLRIGWNSKDGGYIKSDGKFVTPWGELNITWDSVPNSVMTKPQAPIKPSHTKPVIQSMKLIHDTVYLTNSTHKVFLRTPTKTIIYEFSKPIRFEFDVNSVFVTHPNGDYEILIQPNNFIDSLLNVVKATKSTLMQAQIADWEAKMKQYVENGKKLHSLTLRNECNDAIYVAWHFQDYDNTWITQGWIKVPPASERSLLMYTTNNYVYLHADREGKSNYSWKGDFYYWTASQAFTFIDKNGDYSFMEGYESKGFFERVISSGTTIPFTCTNE